MTATPLAALVAVTDSGPDYIITDVDVGAVEPVFPGHYPGFPIFPGVCLVECAHQSARAAAKLTGLEVELAAIDRARFRNPVFPGDHVTTRMQLTRSNGALRCSATLYCGGTEVAAVRLSYRVTGTGDLP